MKTYEVLDPTLRSVSQGDTVFPIVDGKIELPDEIASDLLANGQIVKESKPVDAGPERPMTAAEKRAAAKAAKEAQKQAEEGEE